MSQQNYRDSLSTQDASGKRLFLIPAVVKGVWFHRRKHLQFFLLLLFLAIPWLSWNGKPLLLFNIPERRFFLFGLDLWAHDAPLLFYVLGIAGFGLFLVTALWGRVWCGWACPQTVFIERVFRQIEIWVEGDYPKRILLQRADWNFEKLFKKSLKWVLFCAAAWYISNTFLAYFVGKERLFEMMAHSPYQNPQSFVIMSFFFALVLFDFAWFREQFCTIVCPYGRFQSVLMDENSLVVAYDQKRGEPRGRVGTTEGDCVDCKKCVAVCPTGIDIRNGTQMECIACTACIDACDEIMEKVKRPKGLIRYASSNSLNNKKTAKMTFRAGIYLAILILLSSALTYSLVNKKSILIQELRHQDVPFKIVDTKGTQAIQNIIKLRIHNQGSETSNINFRLSENIPGFVLVNPISPFPAKGKTSYDHSLILQFPLDTPQKNVSLIVTSEEKELKRISIQLLGPTKAIDHGL